MEKPLDSPTTTARPVASWKAAALGRWIVLLLLAGHLLLRQTFAHLSITSLIQLAQFHVLPTESTPRPDWLPHIFDQLYVTELVMIALLPLALRVWRTRQNQVMEAAPDKDRAVRMLGIAMLPALGFLLWGAGHALKEVVFPAAPPAEIPSAIVLHGPRDWYLIIRQSALAAYVLFFIYTFLFFRGRQRYVTTAAIFAVIVSVGCAALDVEHWLGPEDVATTLFGQETLALAILAMFMVIAHFNSILIRGVALIVLAFVGWRQSFRFQSGVPISIAGALLLYAGLGFFVYLRGHSRTLKRAAACLFLLCALGLGYAGMKQAAPSANQKITSWSPQIYSELWKVYEHTRPPEDPAQRMFSHRPPEVQVTDPEVYRLQAVRDAAPTVSVADNIWRLLVWRKKALDWAAGSPVTGSGVGRPWFYEALYHTTFHYGEEREGLDPHNSFLNLLYRYGLIGFGLLVMLIALVMSIVIRALRQRIQGDALLEGLAVYFFYCAIFAFFNNALEGPSYALPFWISLALIYARAWQLTHAKFEV